MKGKLGLTIVGLSVFSFGLFGVNIGDGGVVKAEHGETFAPSFTNTHGEGMSPKKETHADLIAPSLESHGHTGGAPALNRGETPVPIQDTHGHYPAPKLEADGDHGGAPSNTEPGEGI
ncbi:hypothetical protein COL72_28865 [Bacillus toyonensis]|uniref:hypothetical protein n=1 Tax=Bacillus toyonensis TaxID=155322 RepID=UPI000BF85B1E|nr:hypothetical protein [Bacillus toyonensis]PFZ67168.1 hypothetical protein COL72_28865 [Bacillus toyonensis]